MNVNDIFPSRFLKAHDLGGKAFTLTIRAITLEDVGHGAEKESKLTLAFEKATKMMLLNRTNAMIIASMYGPETDAWKGKAVTVYSARVKAFGAWHDALRIKEEIPARNVGAAQMTDAMLEQPPLDDEEDLLDVDEGQEPRHNDIGNLHSVDPELARTAEIMARPHNLEDDLSGDVLFAKESPPHQRMWGQGMSVFGPDWDMARPWLLAKWTAKVTPANTRDSASELNDDEKDALADYIKDNSTVLQRVWRNFKAAQVQSTGEAAS